MTKRSRDNETVSQSLASVHSDTQRALDCADQACASGQQAADAAKKKGAARIPSQPRLMAVRPSPDATLRYGDAPSLHAQRR